MIQALAHHIWLLMTFRHPMTGLAIRNSTAIMLLCVFLTSDILESGPMIASANGLLMLVFYLFTPAFVVAMGLLHTGFNLVSAVIECVMPIHQGSDADNFMPQLLKGTLEVWRFAAVVVVTTVWIRKRKTQ